MSKISITPNPSGTGVFTIASPATNTDRTLTLPDEAGTVLTSASSITQNAGPVFSAYAGNLQAISNASTTKVQINTEYFDIGNCFDTSNYRFTPNVAGYYQINGSLYFNIGLTSDYSIAARIFKNGSEYKTDFNQGGSPYGYYGAYTSSIIYCNGTTDYIELYVYTLFGSSQNLTNGNGTVFSGSLVRAA